jgi:hypothetical protein
MSDGSQRCHLSHCMLRAVRVNFRHCSQLPVRIETATRADAGIRLKKYAGAMSDPAIRPQCFGSTWLTGGLDRHVSITVCFLYSPHPPHDGGMVR